MTETEALSHLHHFCNKLPFNSVEVLKPVFTFKTIVVSASIAHYSCTVRLPSCVVASAREFSTKKEYESEILAKRAAAFEALLGLHNADLLNEHFLPAGRYVDPIYKDIEKRPGLVSVGARANPWREVCCYALGSP